MGQPLHHNRHCQCAQLVPPCRTKDPTRSLHCTANQSPPVPCSSTAKAATSTTSANSLHPNHPSKTRNSSRKRAVRFRARRCIHRAVSGAAGTGRRGEGRAIGRARQRPDEDGGGEQCRCCVVLVDGVVVVPAGRPIWAAIPPPCRLSSSDCVPVLPVPAQQTPLAPVINALCSTKHAQ